MSDDRMTRLRDGLAARDLDVIALMPGANLRYLAGLTFHASKRLTLAFFPADGRAPCMVLPALEAPGLRASAGTTLDLFTWSDEEGPDQALRRALEHLRCGSATRFGIEYPVMRVSELRALEAAWAAMGCAAQTVDGSPLLAEMRMVKDPNELEAMAEAARIVEAALGELLARVRVGVTERQLASICTSEIMDAGAEGESFESFVGGGPNSANPHHTSGDRPLQPGDLVIIDCGAVYRGYASDITRTVALGEPGDRARRIYETVLAANRAARAAVRPGATGEQIDAAARSLIAEAGYGEYFPHRTGHGLGLESHPCHEPPDIVAGSRAPLGPGVVFTIEPGVYVEGLGGVRIEDDVVVTEDGARSLTSFTRELLVLPVHGSLA